MKVEVELFELFLCAHLFIPFLTAYCFRSSSFDDDLQRRFVRCFEIDQRSHAVFESLLPARHAQTPFVAVLYARKSHIAASASKGRCRPILNIREIHPSPKYRPCADRDRPPRCGNIRRGKSRSSDRCSTISARRRGRFVVLDNGRCRL